ncbi:MAG: glycosyltransferase family 4 protein [Anaerolineae bacterium]
MARILFLTQVLPYPLDSGPKIRGYYVLRYLAQRHEVTLVSFVRPDDRPEYVAHLESICRRVITVPIRRSHARDAFAMVKAALQRLPIIIVRDEMAEMRATLQALAQREVFDVIHADQTSMAQYALFAHALALREHPQARPRLVLDAHNALFRVYAQMQAHATGPLKRAYYWWEAHTFPGYEQDVYAHFDHITFVTERDRALACGRPAFRVPTTTIPICIDPAEEEPIAPAPQPKLLTHLGTMFWPPNVDGVLWFAREVFPRVLAQVPDARLVVIGKRPPASVQELGHHPNIDILGYVADPREYLAQTAAFLVPLRAGAGMRVKILDGWRWGLPIVSTTLGAEDIAYRDGHDLLLADEPERYAQAVIDLLTSAARRTTLGANGRQTVCERYDWRSIYEAWGALYDRLLAGAPQTSRMGEPL